MVRVVLRLVVLVVFVFVVRVLVFGMRFFTQFKQPPFKAYLKKDSKKNSKKNSSSKIGLKLLLTFPAFLILCFT